MRGSKPIPFRGAAWLFLAVGGFVSLASAQNLTLRVVTYNIEDDIGVTNAYVSTNSATTPLPGLIVPVPSGSGGVTNGGVLEGIGEEVLADGVAQPVDILALEETSGPSTVNPIVAGLNAFYGARNPLATNMYAASSYVATESGGATNDGNGPNSIIYNTHSLQLLASVPVDPVGGASKLGSSSGEYREVVRYEFAPANQTPTAATEFYVYVSHYKSGGTTTDTNDRADEAVIIRTNEAASLPSNARVLYVGDFNLTTSWEPGYQTILATNSPTGVAQGEGVDPLNAVNNTNLNWSQNSMLNVKTEDDTYLEYRDDLQVPTTNVYNNAAGGLGLVVSTYHAFANNGTTAYEQSVADGTDTALNSDLAAGSPIGATQLYNDLTGAADHLPVVADYTIPVVQPQAAFTVNTTNGVMPLTVTFTDATTNGIVTNWLWNFGDGATSNTYTTTNVTHAYTNAGTYTVQDTVTGPGGMNTATSNNLIIVETPFEAWQLQYFGCTNCPQAQPTADADGTGQDNEFKYIAGLNPTNPASVFTFNISGVSNLVFNPAVAGRTYTALYSANLNGPWNPLTTALAPVTNGAQVTVTDTNTTLPQKYYLIEITGP